MKEASRSHSTGAISCATHETPKVQSASGIGQHQYEISVTAATAVFPERAITGGELRAIRSDGSTGSAGPRLEATEPSEYRTNTLNLVGSSCRSLRMSEVSSSTTASDGSPLAKRISNFASMPIEKTRSPATNTVAFDDVAMKSGVGTRVGISLIGGRLQGTSEPPIGAVATKFIAFSSYRQAQERAQNLQLCRHATHLLRNPPLPANSSKNGGRFTGLIISTDMYLVPRYDSQAAPHSAHPSPVMAPAMSARAAVP